ncbi:MAG: NADP-dependent malic enzyme [uncultured Thermomicrobiales bacterium]|uniref:NADP-dependent malic enzyme n=1 Tax=uncultured Thermomicrobiales bacterium TaxID=1645740 RepID=A0A6J4U894_9BACT|nr:MAG: NADP-dependent malic enzyme [uncultured Thermomicrobiales bacterium]
MESDTWLNGVGDEGLDYRRRYQGLIGVQSKVPVRDRSVLSLVYTPGVAEACLAIGADPGLSYDLTCRGNTVAILTDGSDIFGRAGGPAEAAIPGAEAKSVIFKTFAGVDAFPLCLDTHDPADIVRTGLAVTPTFGAVCIDDISAPAAFTVQDHLERAADIPVFSNQHHGTAILVLAALNNALRVVGKELASVRVVVSGAGVAGIGVARLLYRAGVKHLVVCDRAGAIHKYRPERMNWAKAYLAKETNLEERRGSLAEMLRGADVFVGLSTGGIVDEEMVRSMAPDPIVFALAVPEPEVDPGVARAAGARVVATGRSDYPNTMDVSLVFPGVFRGLLDCRARNIRLRTLLYAARALAAVIPPAELHPDYIVPRIFDFRVAPAVAAAVVQASLESGEAGVEVTPEWVAERTRRYVYEGRFHAGQTGLRGEGKSLKEEAIDLRRRHGGVLEIRSKIPIRDHHILNVLYVPPAALAPARVIRDDPSQVTEITSKGNLVAVVTDGSAVLGLGDIGPRAALPVMEGKAVLFRTLAGVEAFPICLAARDVDEIVEIVEQIAPAFGGINLEDIAAPRCFEVERKLRERLDMPVFHDDQHGTAIVVAAGLLNGAKLRGGDLGDLRVTINGAGAAGIAVTKLLLGLGVGDVVLCDRAGAIYEGRTDHMDVSKFEISAMTNRERRQGSLADVIAGSDVFVGLSAPGTLIPEMVAAMAPRPLVFALANPTPEITPDLAKQAGALAVATGRSDYPNQVNNSLAFPGVFRGALDVKARTIDDAMKLAAARAIADLVEPEALSPDFFIPDSLDLRVSPRVAAAVAAAAIAGGLAQRPMEPREVEARCRDLVYEGVAVA